MYETYWDIFFFVYLHSHTLTMDKWHRFDHGTIDPGKSLEIQSDDFCIQIFASSISWIIVGEVLLFRSPGSGVYVTETVPDFIRPKNSHENRIQQKTDEPSTLDSPALPETIWRIFSTATTTASSIIPSTYIIDI